MAERYLSESSVIQSLEAIPEGSWKHIRFTKAIRDLPAADVVEVVRCKECKYYYAWPDDYRTCHKHYQIDGATAIMGAMGYCSDAIRRKDDDG